MFRTVGIVVLLLLAAAPATAQSPGLTVKTGESWVFSLYRGEPVRARKANPRTKPAPGQVMVTVTSMMGTTMSISSNNSVAYTYKAELIGTGRAGPMRSCTLPANGRLSFENWPQKATAVRLSQFRIADKEGACP
jgi:hypothetical protein